MSRHQGAVAAAQRAKDHPIKLKAPGATCVTVAGSFCGWTHEGYPLKQDRHGVWTVRLALPPGKYEYRFLVDGQWENDPACTERVPNPFGSENCVFRV
ncbi:MAG TPA: glycogen-binding domain-containing protein [Gemmataceae bacterium]|nr:glycogen-binding domain-containing protein [Gemmataceae bacterium]